MTCALYELPCLREQLESKGPGQGKSICQCGCSIKTQPWFLAHKAYHLKPDQSYCCHPYAMTDNRPKSVWVMDFSFLTLLFSAPNNTMSNSWYMLCPVWGLGDSQTNKMQSLPWRYQAVMFIFLLSFQSVSYISVFSLEKIEEDSTFSDLAQMPLQPPGVMKRTWDWKSENQGSDQVLSLTHKSFGLMTSYYVDNVGWQCGKNTWFGNVNSIILLIGWLFASPSNQREERPSVTSSQGNAMFPVPSSAIFLTIITKHLEFPGGSKREWRNQEVCNHTYLWDLRPDLGNTTSPKHGLNKLKFISLLCNGRQPRTGIAAPYSSRTLILSIMLRYHL